MAILSRPVDLNAGIIYKEMVAKVFINMLREVNFMYR